MQKRFWPKGCFVLAWFTLIVPTSLWLVRPPRAVPETAPASEFSSARAMKHVRTVARQPHPLGSEENARVRQYLVHELATLGCDVQLHQAPGWNMRTDQSATLQNIVARLSGTDSVSGKETHGRAILLLCHYDSVSQGPGAGDDASGVAAVLETVRALHSSAPLRHDLIVLITDGEEAGLLGADAFVAEHPWLHDVALVFNFEARGNGGPVLLMQTGHGNGWLIREFARAVGHPFGSSFAEDVFQRMPNDTDFTIFRNAGKTGLNFAFFKGLRYYHTDQDTVANLDERVVQHHGSYCLGLARHFGHLNLDQTRDRDVIFFNLIGTVFVFYPIGWVMPITIVTAGAFLGTIFAGIRQRRLTFWGTAGGLVLQLVVMAASAAAVAGLWMVLSKLPAIRGAESRGDVDRADAFWAFFTLVTVVIFVAATNWSNRWLGLADQATGAFVAWLALTILSCLFVPRGSYLFSWPLLFGAVGLTILLATSGDGDTPWLAVVLICCTSLPAIFLMVPGIYLIAITVGTSLSWSVAACTALLLGLFIPHFHLIRTGGSAATTWRTP